MKRCDRRERPHIFKSVFSDEQFTVAKSVSPFKEETTPEKLLSDQINQLAAEILRKQKPSSLRPELTDEQLLAAHKAIYDKLLYRLQQHGRGSYVSRHEALGIITEEYYELVEAVTSEPISGAKSVREELIDVAVGCLFAIAGIDAGVISK